MIMEFKQFDVKTVELQDGSSNLVEASAGTGKTYSIAILVLRLILEKKVPIEEILMVTFTTAAVAELQERVRKFVRDAYRYSTEEEIDDEVIRDIVDRAGKEEAKPLLYSALLNLDEISVFTIHSFCQQTLNEFAFETGQLFSAELIADDSEIIEREIQDFWRKQVTTLREDLLTELLNVGLSRGNIQKYLKNHLDGKRFFFLEEGVEYELNETEQKRLIELINEKRENVEKTKNHIFTEIQNQREELSVELNVTYANSSFLPLIDTPEALIDKVREILNKYRKKGVSKYVQNFPKLINWVDEIDQSVTDSSDSILESLNYLYSFAIQEISKGIRRFKTHHNLMTFEDLISNLNHALNDRKNEKLEQLLQTKYKAVFIDEFQDTDRNQYGIFKTAFQGKSILFYIGDPKQSIYAWRKADIATYFEARNDVDNVFTMNKNFRSSARMVEALNRFFQPEPDFDVFAYEGQENKIEYHQVDSKGKKMELLLGGKQAVPLTLTTKKNNESIIKDTALGILDLLVNEGWKFVNAETGEERSVRTSDIGVLVRTKKQGDEIKKALAKYGIPAVSVTEAKIFKSVEARDLTYILQAIDNNTTANVNRALLSIFVNLTKEEIQKLDEEKLIEKFKNFKELWKEEGVYSMMMRFISEFRIKEKALAGELNDSERNITNLYHLLELLYRQESRQKMNPTELIDWLKISISLDENDEDEWVQRIESDEEAVKIATIHASKGLEYNIVFAPFLDLNIWTKDNPVVSFRDEDGYYKSGRLEELPSEKQEIYELESTQENRRLLYVTLTRAVHKCFVFSNTDWRYKTSALRFFADVFQPNELMTEWDAEEVDRSQRYTPSHFEEQQIIRPKRFDLDRKFWQRMSYSGLAAEREWIPKDLYVEGENEFDQFTFQKLGKGARTGNLLHGILEKIDFSSSPDYWTYTIKRELEGYKSETASDYDEFIEKIVLLLKHILNADVQADDAAFKLSDIGREDVMHELEFDFPVSEFKPDGLNGILPGNRINVSERFPQQIEGLMTGFVDLFFRYKGKYYVLDWKSNYLGPTVEDYAPDKLDTAMTESNYHLQYMIYTLAAKKYLQSRLGEEFDFKRDFGGVFYLFLRGMREGTPNGVFYKKVTKEEMEKMEALLSVSQV